MSWSSTAVSIPAKDMKAIRWADDTDHTKDFGKQPMGFYQWNVNLFYRFPEFHLNYEDETKWEKPYDISDTATMTIQIINSEEAVYTSATVSFLYHEKKWGRVKKNKDGEVIEYMWNYLYENQITGLSHGAEKFGTFNGVKYTVDCKTKKKKLKLTRLAPIKSVSVLWFRAVPSKNMVNASYSTSFSVREVFHFGQMKGAEDAAAAEEPPEETPPEETPPDTPGSNEPEKPPANE
jgi:hypothetical protein